MRIAWIAATALAVVVPALGDEAGDRAPVEVSGLAFADAFGVVSHHDELVDGDNGFWFRRIYLTFDRDLDEGWDARLRFEANDPGDFSSSKKLEPFVKDIWIRWRRGATRVVFGLSPTPTWNVVEKAWGLRALEKTPLDLFKWGSSRDTGVAILGAFGADRRGAYHVMVGNGSGTSSETDDGKKLAAAASWRSRGGWWWEAYADADERPGRTDRRTAHLFLARASGRGRWGVLLAHQHREVAGGPDLDLELASIYGVWSLGERTELIGRVDRTFDPVPDAARIAYLALDPTAEITFVVAGASIRVGEGVWLMPNVESALYEAPDGAPAPDSDLIARLTAYWRF